MKKLSYLLMLLVLVACNQNSQNGDNNAESETEKHYSQAESMNLKGKVRLVIESYEDAIGNDVDWQTTYHFFYASEEQGFAPEQFVFDDETTEYAEAPADDEFLVDENGEVILPVEEAEGEESEEDLYYDEPDLELYYRYTSAEEETPLIHMWFDEKGDYTEVRYYANEGSAVRKEIYKYDDDHRMLSQQIFDEDGKISLSNKMEYDSLGNEIYNESFAMGYNDGEVQKTRSTYNQQGNLLNAVTTVLGKQVSLREYKYDDKGNIVYNHSEGRGYSFTQLSEYNAEGKVVKETQLKLDGSVQNITTYKYDNLGNNVERTMTSFLDKPEGEELSRVLMQYDKQGNCIKSENYYKGKLEMIDRCQFDSRGLVIFSSNEYYTDYESYSDTTSTLSMYKYNKNGDCVESIFQSSERGNVRIRTTSEYTSDGLLREQRTYETSQLEEQFCGKGKAPERLVERLVYTYDSHGNWIKQEYFNTIIADEDFTKAKGETRDKYEELSTGVVTRRIDYYE